jgi:hypothetical protein
VPRRLRPASGSNLIRLGSRLSDRAPDHGSLLCAAKRRYDDRRVQAGEPMTVKDRSRGVRVSISVKTNEIEWSSTQAHPTRTSFMDLALLVEIATAVIAVAALFRPEIEKTLRRHASNLDFQLIGVPALGYSGVGPSIGITATLTGLHSTQYISTMTCHVKRRQDKSEFTFPWFLFQPPEAAVTGGNISGDTTIQVASPFAITVDESVTKHFIFRDLETFRIISGLSKLLDDEWHRFKNLKITDGKLREIATQVSSTSGTNIDMARVSLAYEA